MQVSEIWRYPVKSLQGERLQSAPVDSNGILGDRGWALVDAESGVHLTARREPQLLFAAARVEGDRPDGLEVVLTLPDGTETADDAAISTWLGRDVRLVRAAEDTAGTFETQADETETGEWFQWTGRAGSFHDSTVSPISLVSADTFRQWEPRRFRINVTLDAPGDVDLVHNEVDVGSARLGVVKRIDRCVMTTRPQPANGDDPAFGRDLDVLRTINAEMEQCLGVGAMVVTEGVVSVGDPLRVAG